MELIHKKGESKTEEAIDKTIEKSAQPSTDGAIKEGEQVEINPNAMSFEHMMIVLGNGYRVKLPEWKGFWFIDTKTKKHMVKLASGEVVDTPDLESYKDRKDWQITNMTMTEEEEIKFNKAVRQDADVLLQAVKNAPPSRERSIAITKFQEAMMWLGMDLKRLGTSNPYPESKNPQNAVVEPTADGLKY